MPWKETCPMEQRVEMVGDWLQDEASITELSKIYGVSRVTIYKWNGSKQKDPRVSGNTQGHRTSIQMLFLPKLCDFWYPPGSVIKGGGQRRYRSG
jgi:transposase-like protein